MSPKVRDVLERYRGRRDFSRTPEPEPSTQIEGRSRFVIQKHAARRLHYDLRFEFDWGFAELGAAARTEPGSNRQASCGANRGSSLKYLEFEGAIPKG